MLPSDALVDTAVNTTAGAMHEKFDPMGSYDGYRGVCKARRGHVVRGGGTFVGPEHLHDADTRAPHNISEASRDLHCLPV